MISSRRKLKTGPKPAYGEITIPTNIRWPKSLKERIAQRAANVDTTASAYIIKVMAAHVAWTAPGEST